MLRFMKIEKIKNENNANKTRHKILPTKPSMATNEKNLSIV